MSVRSLRSRIRFSGVYDAYVFSTILSMKKRFYAAHLRVNNVVWAAARGLAACVILSEMNGTVRWRGYVRVKNKNKALERFNTMRKLIGKEANLVSCEQYWKTKELYEIVFTTDWSCDTVEKAVFEVLILSQKLQIDWDLSGPHVYQNGVVQIEGLFNSSGQSTKIPNLEWMLYQLHIEIG